MNKNISFFPDQKHGLSLLRSSIRSGHHKIVYAASVSHGKTIIMGHIASESVKRINKHTSKENRVWIVVDAIELVNQTRDKFRQFFNLDTGVIQGQHEDTDWSKQVQVCMAQTIANRLRVLEAHKEWMPDILMIDEAHIMHKSTQRLMSMMPDKSLVIAMTATPLSKGMGKIYTDLVTPATTGQLIDDGRLSPIRYFSCDTNLNYKNLKKSNGDYTAASSAEVLDDALKGEIVPNWEKNGQNRKTLVYCSTVDQSIEVQQEFILAGIPAYQMDGFTHKDTRPQQMKEFESNEPGTVNVMVSVMTMVKGNDITDIGCICFYRITRSKKIWFQSLGRGVRKSEIYPDVLVLDFGGNISRLGLLEDFNPDDHGLCDGTKNNDTKEDEEKVIKERDDRKCPNCSYVKKVNENVCPNCLYETVPQRKETETEAVMVVAGDMQEVTTAGKRNRKTSKEDKQAFYSGLLKYAQDKGFKQGWAANKYKSRFSVWPNAYKKIAANTVTEDVLNFITSGNIAYANRKNK